MALLLYSEREGMLEALNRGMLLSLRVIGENVATHFSMFLKVKKSRNLQQWLFNWGATSCGSRFRFYFYSLLLVRCSLVLKLESLVLEPQILTLYSIIKVFKFEISNRVLLGENSSQSSARHCTLSQ